MTANTLARLLCGAAIGMVTTIGLAQAQQPEDFSKLDNLPREYWRRLDEHNKALRSLDDSDAARGVYSTIWLWQPTYPKLRVCFFGGPQDVRAKIAAVAKDWESADMSIRFDFGDESNPRLCGQGDNRENQIRISFDQQGFWSALGQFSVVLARQDEPSLNLQDLDKMPVDRFGDFEHRVIRHEFGHALGLYHEHQSPDAKCDYNWDVIYKYLEGPPNNWPRDQIDFNMKPLDTSLIPGITLSEFDKTSVMLYQFPDSYYQSGAGSRCFVPALNHQISRVDREIVNHMYPANPQARMEQFQKRKDAFAAIWNKESDDGQRGVMVDMMKAFFESAGTAGQ